MTKRRLGHWTFESGNACHATMECTPPSGVMITFAWKSPLNDADRDRYACEVLPEAARLTLGEVELMAQIVSIRRELVSEGIVARVGANDDGEPIWAITEKGRAMKTAPRKPRFNHLWAKARRIAVPNWLRGLRRGV